MGCAAKVIVFDDVRASQQRQALRQQLHAHFDRWLDEIEAEFPESGPPLAQVSEPIWRLRQNLTAGVAQTIVAHTHLEEQRRESLRWVTCERLLRARPAVSRTAQTMIGDIEVQRPYFYCHHCHCGRYPLDEVLGLSAGRMQLGVPGRVERTPPVFRSALYSPFLRPFGPGSVALWHVSGGAGTG